MKVYQIWYETWVGPTFSTREKANEYLTPQELENSGYPMINELIIDDINSCGGDR